MSIIRTKEDIQEDIDKLKVELEKSIKYYEYDFVCSEQSIGESIGCFNIGNTKKLLKLLYDGSTLQFRHGFYKTVDVWMNPQRNRIIISENDKLNEDNIISFMLWHSGSWFKKNDA